MTVIGVAKSHVPFGKESTLLVHICTAVGLTDTERSPTLIVSVTHPAAHEAAAPAEGPATTAPTTPTTATVASGLHPRRHADNIRQRTAISFSFLAVPANVR